MRKLSQLNKSVLLAFPLVVLLIPPGLFGQAETPKEYRIFEIGVRQLFGDVYGRPDLPFQPSLRTSKFNEYQDIRNGFFVRRADVVLENTLPGNYLHLQTQSSFRND